MINDAQFRTIVKQLLDNRNVITGFLDVSVYSIKDFLDNNNIVLDWESFVSSE